LKYIKEFDEFKLEKADSVLIVGKAKDLNAIRLEKLENVMKQVEMPKQVLNAKRGRTWKKKALIFTLI
jgi:hypothetical protein